MMNGFGSVLWWPVMATLGMVGIVVGVLIFIFWILMIVDCAKRSFKNDAEKIVWIIVLVLLGWIGALVYYLVIKMSNPQGLSKK